MFAAVLLFISTIWPAPPPGAMPAGCQIQDSIIKGQSKVWLVYGDFVFPDGTQKRYLFSHREANERKKALLDCEDFIAHYEKRAKKEGKK